MPLIMVKQKKRFKKHWFRVYADKTFNNAFLGEIHVSTPDKALNKPIFSNLSLLTGNYNHQYVNLVFIINKISEERIEAKLKRYELQQAFIKRLVRKKRSKITDSFIVTFKDCYAVIKPLLITISNASKEVSTALRKAVRLEIGRVAQEKNFEDFVVEVIEGKIVLNAKKKISKIYPITNLELRVLEVIPKEKVKIDRLVKLESTKLGKGDKKTKKIFDEKKQDNKENKPKKEEAKEENKKE